MTRILKQNVGLEHILGKILSLISKGGDIFFRFLKIRQYCAEPAIYALAKLHA